MDVLVSAAYKWLAGPFGAALMYVSPALQRRIVPGLVGFRSPRDMWQLDADYDRLRLDDDASRFEFATMAFGAAQALAASVEYLCGSEVGVSSAQRHTLALTDRLDTGLRALGFDILSPREHAHERSAIIAAAIPEALPPADELKSLLAQRERIHVSNRGGMLRVSPHVYNTADDIEHLLFALGKMLP